MKNKTQALPVKHIPQRTCVACRKNTVKRELVRVVRVASGEVEVDLTGKKSGRGAYLCADLKCWEAAIESGRLGYALRTTIKSANRDALVNYARGLDNNKGSLTQIAEAT
jgi:uncharacterized protein